MVSIPRLRRLVACTDGSAAAEPALDRAVALAHAAGAEVVFARAWAKPYAELSPEEAGRIEDQVRTDVGGSCGERADELGVPWSVATAEGGPPELVDLVEALGPDLVLAGYRGGGGWAGLHLGGTAHHMVRTLNRPFMLVPEGATAKVGTIVVGVDESEHAARTGALAGALGAATGARVVAATAYEPFVEFREPSDPESMWSHIQGDLAGPWTAPIRESGAHVETDLVRDVHPVAALARLAEQVDADLVVVGRHGRGTWIGSRVGHTALGVLDALHHRAVCIVP